MIADAEYIPSPEQMDALLIFLPTFDREDFVPSRVESPPGYVSYHVFAEELHRFHAAVYENGFVYSFAWSDWHDSAKSYYEQPSLIRSADIQVLRKLITFHVRKERYCEGHLPLMVKSGHIAAILRRLKELRMTAESSNMARTSLHDLSRDAWELHRNARATSYLAQPSTPILYFGDEPAFSRSERRIITVGLNPSRVEFPASDPFARFPAAKQLLGVTELATFHDDYLNSLNRYFVEKPYKSWFASFEAMLKGFDCSYYPGNKNTALHTDLCSPLATDPTWSGLPKAERIRLTEGGVKLWSRLVERLRPHMILVSVAKHHLANISFLPMSEWRTIYTLPRDNPYELRHRIVQISENNTHIIFGRAANTPFGTVSHADKLSIGRLLADKLFSGAEPLTF